jgi:hypothetical protein
MKRRIKKILSHAAFLLFVAGLLPLTAQSEEQIKKFKKERVAFFTERLELTETESAAFWPLYEDFSNRKMKLVEDERNTIKYAHENADNLSDKEIMETLAKVSRLKEQTLELEVEYYQDKFLKAIPPRKVLKLGKVEWDFRRHLYRELRGQKDGQGRGGRGGGQGNGHSSSEGSQPGPSPILPQALDFF